MTSRFVTITPDELEFLDSEKESKSTKRTMKRSVALFRQFLGEENEKFEEMSKPEIAKYLRFFYASVRKQNGDEMKKSSLNALKYGITKYLKEECGIDAEQCEEFAQCRMTYKAKLCDLQKNGKGSVDHKSEISEADLNVLYDPDNIVFKTDTPVGLQKKVWWDIMYHLCRRGQENLRSMTKSTFAVAVDSTGQEYVHQVVDEADKNHGAEASADDTVGEGRMYARPADPMCPVRSFKKYVAHLHPELDDLWQRPLETFTDSSDVWYSRAVLGKNTLAKMMSEIARIAGLSQHYTNHCIRATAIQALDRAEFEARHITRISGHKSETSIKSYSRRLSEQTKRSISETLSKMPGTSRSPVPSTSTDGMPEPMPENIEMNNDIPLDVLEQIFNDDNMFVEVHAPNENIIVNETTQNQNLNIMSMAPAPENAKPAVLYNPIFNNCVVHFNVNK